MIIIIGGLIVYRGFNVDTSLIWVGFLPNGIGDVDDIANGTSIDKVVIARGPKKNLVYN